MTKYNLGIGNIGKMLFITGLTIISVPLISFSIFSLDNQFLKEHTLISMFFILILPLGLFILWLISQKNKDILKVTSIGIESENHGTIEWKDIDKCSFETFRGSIMIYLKLKNNTRLSIGVSTLKNHSIGYDALHNFFNEIQQERDKLQEKDKFRISKERLSGIFNLVFLIFIVVLIAAIIITNLL